MGIFEVEEINNLIQVGDLEAALKEAERRTDLYAQILKVRILERQHRLDDANFLIDHILEKLETQEAIELKFAAWVAKASVQWRKGELDNAMDSLNRSDNYYQTLASPIITEIERWRGLYFLNYGSIEHDQGNLESAEKKFLESLRIREKVGNKRDLSVVYNNLGNIYVQNGKISQGLEYYHYSLAIHQELNNNKDIAHALGNIGIIYRMKGKLEESHDYLSRCYSIFEETGQISGMAHALDYLGLINYQLGDLEKSHDQLTRCLTLKRQIGNDVQISLTLFYLIIVTSEFDDDSESTQYLEDLELINDSTTNLRINLFYNLSKAILLKTKNRMIHKSDALRLFSNITKNKVVDYEWTIFAYLNLCELLILELKQYGNEEVLDEINTLLDELFSISTNKELYPTLAETYLLKSNISLLESDPKKAQQYLQQAQLIAEENGLFKLAIKVSNTYDTLLAQLNTWEEMIEGNVSINEKIEYLEMEEIFHKLINRKAEDTALQPEKPILFQLYDMNNNPFYTKEFQWGFEDYDSINQYINSTILQANHPTRNGGLPQRNKFENFSLLSKFSPSFTLVYVFEGQSFAPYKKIEAMNEFIQTFSGLASGTQVIEINLREQIVTSFDNYVAELFTDSTSLHNSDNTDPDTTYHDLDLNISKDLKNYKDLLHPIRIGILQLLIKEYRIARSDITKLMGLSSGAISSHLDLLLNSGIISRSQEFIDDKPRIVYYLEQSGYLQYTRFKEVLSKIL